MDGGNCCLDRHKFPVFLKLFQLLHQVGSHTLENYLDACIYPNACVAISWGENSLPCVFPTARPVSLFTWGRGEAVRPDQVPWGIFGSKTTGSRLLEEQAHKERCRILLSSVLCSHYCLYWFYQKCKK